MQAAQVAQARMASQPSQGTATSLAVDRPTADCLGATLWLFFACIGLSVRPMHRSPVSWPSLEGLTRRPLARQNQGLCVILSPVNRSFV